jgi:cholinesterase
MSGSVFCKPWSLVARHKLKKYTEQLARDLGWMGNAKDEKSLLEFFENAPAMEITEKSLNFPSEDDTFGWGSMIAFGPTIEPYKSGICIIDRDPVEMARKAWSNEIEMIFMGTSFEGLGSAFGREDKAYSYLKNPAHFCPLIELDLSVKDPFAREYGERIKNLYFGENQRPSIETQESYLRYCSDFYSWHGIYRSILSRQSFASGRTYLLRFDVNGTLNFAKNSVNCQHYNGAAHFDDIFYLFKTNFTDVPEETSKEFKTIQSMVQIFTNFATSSDPNYPHEFEFEISPVIDKNVINCIEITEKNMKQIELPKQRRLDVWNSIYEDHGVALF